MAINYVPSKGQAGKGLRDSSGNIYITMPSGALQRLNPKPKRGKKERMNARRASKRTSV